MNLVKDLTGKTSGRLKVLRRADVQSRKRGGAYWTVLCGCGKIITVRGSDIANHNQKSCGCLKGYYDTRYAKSYAAKSLALHFLRDYIEVTLDFTDSIHADRLSYDLCEFAAGFPGVSIIDYPTIIDLISVIHRFNIDLINMHHQLHGMRLPNNWDFEIYGIKYKI